MLPILVFPFPITYHVYFSLAVMTITLCDNYIVVPCVCVFPFVFCRLHAFHLGTDNDQGSIRKNLKKLLKVLGEVAFFFLFSARHLLA